MKIGAIIPMFFLPFEEVDIRGGRIRKISSFSDRYSKGQSRNKGQGRGGVKVINMSSFEGNKKRSYEGTKPRITKEIAFPTCPLEVKAEKVKCVINWILSISLSPFVISRPSSNNGRAKKDQDSTNGVCYHEVPFRLQRHVRKDENEEPWSSRIHNPLDDEVPNGYWCSHYND
ncbi:hypothetical protein Tco_0221090 [Tanacetum coccineum]